MNLELEDGFSVCRREFQRLADLELPAAADKRMVRQELESRVGIVGFDDGPTVKGSFGRSLTRPVPIDRRKRPDRIARFDEGGSLPW